MIELTNQQFVLNVPLFFFSGSTILDIAVGPLPAIVLGCMVLLPLGLLVFHVRKRSAATGEVRKVVQDRPHEGAGPGE